MECELVCDICRGSLHCYGNIQIGGNRVDQQREGLGLGLLTALSGHGDGNLSILLGEGHGELAAVNHGASVIGGPCKGNLGIGRTGQRDINHGILGNAPGQHDVAQLHIELFGITSLGQLAVGKCLSADGNQVEVAAVELDDTGDIGGVPEIIGMQLLEGLLLILGDAVVGGGDTDISFLIGQLELVVAAGGLLTGDLNTLDGDEHRLSLYQSGIGECLGIGVCLGVVNGSNLLDRLVDDGDGGIDDLIQAVVGILGTGSLNGHTDLESQIRLGILGIDQAVYIVTALVLQVLNVNAVTAGAVGLGEDTDDNALNGNNVTVCGCRIVGIRELLVCGNLAVEALLNGLAGLALDGSGQLISDLGLGLFVDVNGEEAILFACLDGNTLGNVNGPLNSVSHAVDHNTSDHIEVGRGDFCVILIQAEQVIAGGGQIADSVAALLLLTALLIAAGNKEGEAKSQTHENRNQLFHHVLLFSISK